ncbi:MAG TPA: hypothetical protein VK436_16185 [Methanocella sp.]|nr:hypothetical protein [Methanocella sp.]
MPCATRKRIGRYRQGAISQSSELAVKMVQPVMNIFVLPVSDALAKKINRPVIAQEIAGDHPLRFGYVHLEVCCHCRQRYAHHRAVQDRHEHADRDYAQDEVPGLVDVIGRLQLHYRVLRRNDLI